MPMVATMVGGSRLARRSSTFVLLLLLMVGCVVSQTTPALEDVIPVDDLSGRCSSRYVYRATNSRAVLRCDALPDWEQHDTRKVTWYRPDNSIAPGDDSYIEVSPNGRYLTISSVQIAETGDEVTHDGRWACRVHYCNRTSSSISALSKCIQRSTEPMYACIKIVDPPTAEMRYHHNVVIAGHRFRLHCNKGGSVWVKASFHLNNNRSYDLPESSNNIELDNATTAMEGDVTCVVRDDRLNQTASSTAKVTVYEPPGVKVPEKVINVYSGTTVILNCSSVNVDDDIQPVTVSWTAKDNRGVLCSQRTSQHLYLGEEGTSGPAQPVAEKALYGTSMYDSGIYYCEARSPRLERCLDPVSVVGVKLNVVDRPPVAKLTRAQSNWPQEEQHSVVRVYGTTRPSQLVVLQCSELDFVPRLSRERLWYLNDTLLTSDSNEVRFSFSSDKSTLYLKSFKPDMAGFYSCSMNYIGFPAYNSTRTNPFQVVVQVPPLTEVTSNSADDNYLFYVGDHLRAVCNITTGSGLRLFSRWMRRVGNVTYALPMIEQEDMSHSILDLQNLNVRDSGEYICSGTDPDLVVAEMRRHTTRIQVNVNLLATMSTAEHFPLTTSVTERTSAPTTVATSDGVNSLGPGSRVTDDKLYITVAIVGAVVALLMAIFILIVIVYIRGRRQKDTELLYGELGQRSSHEQVGNGYPPNNAPQARQAMGVPLAENTAYESVMAVSRSASEKSEEPKKEPLQRDDGIADCSSGDTAPDTQPVHTMVIGGGGADTNGVQASTHVAHLASSSTATTVGSRGGGGGGGGTASDVESSIVYGGDNASQVLPSDVDSEFYAEPLDRSVHARTSIRSFASAMREEGSRTPRGVILRKVQNLGSQDGDTYSLPHDASVQIIDPDDNSEYAAPLDASGGLRRPSNIIPVDVYSMPSDSTPRRTGDQLFIRDAHGGSGGAVRAVNHSRSGALRHGSSISTRSSLIGSYHGINTLNSDGDNISRSPSPVDESLYSEPYAEPPSSMDAIYNTLRKNQRYRDVWPDNVKLENALGSGRFGNVYSGVWTENGITRQVAVKTLKDGVDPHERLLFLQEAAIMGQFRHRNLVRLYGVVTQGDTLMLVEELMCSDNLRQYLLKYKPDVNGLPSEMQFELLNMCKGIADGMTYLANRAFVHRDLAARNIMLDGDRTCKIGDFGMSRGMESDHYESSGGVIPVKWSAPEAIEYRSFSSASDVWSYGIVLYEIWTFGKCPYAFFENEVVMAKLKEGYRLPRPDYSPPLLYELMRDCWEEDKKRRPSFQQILQRLDGPPEALLRMPKALLAAQRQRQLAANDRKQSSLEQADSSGNGESHSDSSGCGST